MSKDEFDEMNKNQDFSKLGKNTAISAKLDQTPVRYLLDEFLYRPLFRRNKSTAGIFRKVEQ